MLSYRKHWMGLFFVALVMLGIGFTVRAQSNDVTLILDDPQTSYPVGVHLEYLKDPDGDLTIEDVTRPEFAARFVPSQEQNPNFGITNSAYWFRLPVRNETSQVDDWRLAFADARMGLIDLYYQQEGETGWIHQQAGRFRPATEREYIHPYFVFPLGIPPSTEGTIYLRLQSNMSIRFSLSLWPAELFAGTEHGFFLLLGAAYGIMIVMALYNLMIFFFLKKPTYLYYFLFISVITFNTACIDGVAYAYLFPNWTHEYTHIISALLAPIFGILLIRDFLELKNRIPWLDRILTYLVVLAALFYLAFFFNNSLGYLGLAYIPIMVAFLAIVAAVIVWRQGLFTARYFLLGWLGLLSNVIFRNLSVLGIIPSSPAYDWTFYLSIVLMVIFLSLALADQINLLRTQAAQAALAQQESEIKHRILVEQANDGIIVVQEGQIVFANSFAEEMSGYSTGEFLNTSFISHIVENDQPRISDLYQRRIAGEDVTEIYETTFKRKDGSRIDVEVNAGLTVYDGKSSTLVIVRDITERKWIEAQKDSALKALNESEHKYRTLVEMANDAIIVIQAEKIKFANARFSQMTGFTLDQIQDTPYDKYLPAEQLPKIVGMYQRREAADTPSIYETFIQRKDGSQVAVEFSASLTTFAGQTALLVLVRDIKERKKYEAELRQYSEHLEELVAERTRELEVSRAKLSLLNRSSQTINMAGLDSEQVYVAIRAACAWLVAADAVTISLVDQAAGEVEDVYLIDRDQRLKGNRYPLHGSFVGDVLEEGVSCRIDDFRMGTNGDQHATWLPYFPDMRSGMAVLLRGSKEYLGLMTVQSYAPNAYSEDDQSIVESFASHISITLENIRNYKQLERSAVIQERQRLASELHDSATQLLYSMALMSNAWGVKAKRNQLSNPADNFFQIEELSLQALKEMRMLIYQLRPPVLAEIGLLKALEDRLEKVERRVKIDARVHVEGSLPRLSPVLEEELYFITLEALNNSLRHARASSVQINFRKQVNQLHMSIVDNGRGYDLSRASKGMGTAILDYRATAIDAKIKRDSQPGQGTRIEVEVEV